MSTALVFHKAPFDRSVWTTLPLGSVKPQGWLRRQLQIQAEGLSGHIDEFWPDLSQNSGWLGGKGESWERGPYFTDGLVPLAHLLGDAKLIEKANKWVSWTLDHPHADGWIGPGGRRDWWARTPMLKALAQHHEATGDARVIPVLSRFFELELKSLRSEGLVPKGQNKLHSWAYFRWQDNALVVLWLYDRTGDEKLIELARELHKQGYNWTEHFWDFRFTGRSDCKNLDTHGVNNGMGIKAPAIAYLITRAAMDGEGVYKALANLDKWHGTAAGIFTCDEHFAGREPFQGTELCTVGEQMYSLEHAISILGDAKLADRLERIAYNAWPGTFDAKMWAHQYDQQANQVLCTVDKRNWTNNRDDANTYGLEPHFGCCTANFHQGWPKFAANCWMASPDGGLVAAVYAPSTVTSVIKGQKLTIEERTEYPFDDRIVLTVRTEKPVEFPLYVRIPEWARRRRVVVAGDAEAELKEGSYKRINRTWRDGDTVELTFPMDVRLEGRLRGAVSVHRGPLVYSLRIGEEWRKIKGQEPHADWAVHPTTPWNYALVIDQKKNLQLSFVLEKRAMGEYFFDSKLSPVVLWVRGRRVPQWQMEKNSAGPTPQSPVMTAEKIEDIALIPYGAAKLRITEFPVAAE